MPPIDHWASTHPFKTPLHKFVHGLCSLEVETIQWHLDLQAFTIETPSATTNIVPHVCHSLLKSELFANWFNFVLSASEWPNIEGDSYKVSPRLDYKWCQDCWVTPGRLWDQNEVSASCKYFVPKLTFTHIITSPRTIKKRWQQLGLTSSRATMKKLDPTAAEQLVRDQMDHDPARHQGPQNIRHNIAMKTGICMTYQTQC